MRSMMWLRVGLPVTLLWWAAMVEKMFTPWDEAQGMMSTTVAIILWISSSARVSLRSIKAATRLHHSSSRRDASVMPFWISAPNLSNSR